MKKHGIILTAIVASFAMVLMATPAAHAQTRIGNGAILKKLRDNGAAAKVGRGIIQNRGVRDAVRGAARNASRHEAFSRSSRMGRSAGLSRVARGGDHPVLDALRNGAQTNHSSTPILDALRYGGYNQHSSTPILDALRGAGYGNGYYGNNNLYDRYDHGYRRDDEYADAYRDVGLANAAVNLVGIIANTATQRPAYVQAQPVVQYETQRVLVQEGRYIREQVWVPEIYDPRTGVKTDGGYYETRSRYQEPVYEERLVRLPR